MPKRTQKQTTLSPGFLIERSRKNTPLKEPNQVESLTLPRPVSPQSDISPKLVVDGLIRIMDRLGFPKPPGNSPCQRLSLGVESLMQEAEEKGRRAVQSALHDTMDQFGMDGVDTQSVTERLEAGIKVRTEDAERRGRLAGAEEAKAGNDQAVQAARNAGYKLGTNDAYEEARSQRRTRAQGIRVSVLAYGCDRFKSDDPAFVIYGDPSPRRHGTLARLIGEFLALVGEGSQSSADNLLWNVAVENDDNKACTVRVILPTPEVFGVGTTQKRRADEREAAILLMRLAVTNLDIDWA